MSTEEARGSQHHEEEQDDTQAHMVRKGMNVEAETDDAENDDVEAHGFGRHSGPRES